MVEGVFGDVTQNKAYIKRKFHAKEGWVIEFFGCKYLWKGTLFGSAMDSGATLKRLLMASIRLVLKYPWFFSPLVLIFHKTALKALIYWFAEVYEADLKQKTYKRLSEFSPVPRELIRAGLTLADRIPLKRGKMLEDAWDRREFESDDPSEYRIRVRRVVWCIGTFIQADSAYYKRVQDALSDLSQMGLWKNPRAEVLRLFDLVLSREKTIPHKIHDLRKIASLLLLFPPFRDLIRVYLNELRIEEFYPDDADRYFNGRNQGYDFEGKPLEERRKWSEDRDKDMGNVIIST